MSKERIADGGHLNFGEYDFFTFVVGTEDGMGNPSNVFTSDITSLNVVPEPSTYATIFGIMALAVTLFIRKRKS